MNVALLLAAGRSQRFGQNKLWLDLGGVPVWQWSYEVLLEHPEIDEVVIVTSQDQEESFRQELGSKIRLVVGDFSERQDSVRAGFKVLSEDTKTVVIHDAARPFLTVEMVSDLIRGAQKEGAACPGSIPVDTIKMRSLGGLASLTRSNLLAVQTPQVIQYEWLKKAYQMPTRQITDDVSLLEPLGINPYIVEADPYNFKITTRLDYQRALQYIQHQETRMGIGYDIHPFSEEPGRPLWLGGVLFEGEQGLEGHSDADVLLHAVVDALLGAIAQGDIGEHFVNTDPRWKNASSLVFLGQAAYTLRQEGWRIINVDSVVIAEHPKVMKRSKDIRQKISETLGIDFSRVSIKATTNEKLGSIGRKEGIASFATAVLQRHPKGK